MGEDGSVVIVANMNISDAEKELERLRKKILNLEDSLRETGFRKSKLAEQSAEMVKNLDAAKAKLYEMESAAQGIFSKEQIEEQKNLVRVLQSEWDKVENEIDKCNKAIRDGNIELEYTKQRYAETADNADRLRSGSRKSSKALQEAAENAGKLAPAISSADGFLDKFTKRINGLLKRVFIFSLITSALRNMRTWIGNTVNTSRDATAAMNKLKGALLTLAQPILGVIIPAFTILVNLLAKIVGAIANFVSALFGTTIEESAQAAENLYDEENALKGVGAAAKKAGKSLASFDEINQLSGGDSGGGGGGASAAERPDFAGFIMDELSKIEGIVGGFLLAIGAILTFSGINIPLGITLMALGAAMIYHSLAENWGAVSEKLRGPLGVIMAILGGFLIVLGVILLFTGANIGVGLMLIALGAAAMYTTMAANWDTISALLKGPLGAAMAIAGAFLIVIGLVLLASGANIALGLGLIAIGALTLAPAIAANWNTVVSLLQGPLGAVMAIGGLLSLCVGLVLMFSGANFALGLGLTVIGAVLLGSAIAANWSFVSSTLQGPFGMIVAIGSILLLCIGLVLVFSGAALALGMGLLVAGAVLLGSSIAANWNYITETLGGPFNAIMAMASAFALVIGIVLLFAGVAAPLGLGLIIAGATGLAATVAPNWDFVQEKISKAWSDLQSWWRSNAAKWFTSDHWTGMGKNMVDGLLGGLKGAADAIAEWAGGIINSAKDALGIHSPSTETKDMAINLLKGLVNTLYSEGGEAVEAFASILEKMNAKNGNNVDQMTNAFVEFLKYLSTEFASRWTSTFSTMYSFAYTYIQKVIREINALNAKLASIERNIVITITTVYKTSGDSGGSASTSKSAKSISIPPGVTLGPIPALATGTVIPPNRRFLAELGDNKQEPEVVSPLSTMKQAFKEAMMEIGYSGNSQQEAVMMVDGEVFGRLSYKLGGREGKRIGVNLVEA